MQESININKFLKIIKRRCTLIIMTICIVTGLSALITYYLITPTYQASTLLLVNQSVPEGKNYSSGELQTNLELINTYNVIITSPRILKQVVEELSLNQSYRSLIKRVNVESEGQSQVVSIHVKDSDPKIAVEIANTIATIFHKEIVKIMNVNNVSILSPAEVSPSPISPNPKLNISIGFVAGLLLSIAISLIMETLDNRIRNEIDVEKTLEVPLLGTVMNIKVEKKRTQREKEFIKESEEFGT